MLTTDVLKTIRSQNSGRDYPLDPVRSVLPFPILIDAEISVPYSIVSEDGKNQYTVFLKYLAVTTSDITIVVAVHNNINNSVVEVASAYCTYTQLSNTLNSTDIAGIPLSPIDNREGITGISGFIYLGDPDVIMANGGVWELTKETAKFNTQCIHPYQEGFSGFMIDGQKLTGDVILRAGEGINIEVIDNSVINITATSCIEDYLIKDRDALIQAITDKYGKPITTINNIRPSATGNFVFKAADKSCVEVENCSYGISISNPCATTCCDDSYLDFVIENLNTLNAKSARLTEYLTAVSTNLNSLINELAMLKLGAGN